MNQEQIERILDRLQERFEKNDDGETGLDIIENCRIPLEVKGELSERQHNWMKRNMKIHGIREDEDKRANDAKAREDI